MIRCTNVADFLNTTSHHVVRSNGLYYCHSHVNAKLVYLVGKNVLDKCIY